MRAPQEKPMETMEMHAEKMETKLNQWLTKLDELVAKTKEAGTDVKSDYRQRIDELRAKYQVAQAKLAELRAAGRGNWESFKAGVESSWNDIETAYKNLVS
jgi:hypothetical protein